MFLPSLLYLIFLFPSKTFHPYFPFLPCSRILSFLFFQSLLFLPSHSFFLLTFFFFFPSLFPCPTLILFPLSSFNTSSSSSHLHHFSSTLIFPYSIRTFLFFPSFLVIFSNLYLILLSLPMSNPLLFLSFFLLKFFFFPLFFHYFSL